MKFFHTFLLVSLPLISAHPALHYQDLIARVQSKLEKRLLVASLDSPVEVTGSHAFVAPDLDAGDQRGPCPGLNALANHGYISRDGVVSLVDVVLAMNTVYGMGIDLGTVLAVMATVWVGNPLSLDPGFSIGSYSEVDNLFGILSGLLGTPRGLTGSHNFLEADSSNTRGDLYLGTDNYKLQISKFNDWYRMSNSTVGDFTSDVQALRASDRYHASIAENPQFYYGPVTGFISRNAGFTFPRMFRNHSTENPEGTLTKEILTSFYAISGEEGSFTYTEGHESIPDNWYRSPTDYGLVEFNVDLVSMITQYPELANIGGNTGTVNSFTGLDLSNITGGALNIETLLEGNNLLCFALQVVRFVAPNSLSSLFETIAGPLEMVTSALAQPILDLGCPALQDLEVGGQSWLTGIEELFPGVAASNGGL